MPPLLRIALLECDELEGEIKQEYGSIGNVYKGLLEAGASRLEATVPCGRPQLAIFSYDVVKKQEYPDIDTIDAVFITGSRK
jgi:hypothetical protein